MSWNKKYTLNHHLVSVSYWVLDKLLFFSISMVTKRFHYPKTLPRDDVRAFCVYFFSLSTEKYIFICLRQKTSHSKESKMSAVEVIVLCVLPHLLTLMKLCRPFYINQLKNIFYREKSEFCFNDT